MRLHFAAEIVLVLLYKRFSGVEKRGAHIAAGTARIDDGWAGGPKIAAYRKDLAGPTIIREAARRLNYN